MVRSINNVDQWGLTPYVVGPDSATAPYTTIQSAINAAVAAGSLSTVYITAGAYSENITVPANITLVGAIGQTADIVANPVIILGSLTFTGVTAVNIANLTLAAQGATPPVQITGAGLTQVNFSNVNVSASSGAAISYTNSNASSAVFFYECNIFQNGAFAHYLQSGGFLQFSYCFLGASLGVANTQVPSVTSSTGNTFFLNSSQLGGVQTTGTGRVTAEYSQIESATIAVDSQSTVGSDFLYTDLTAGGTSSALNIGAGSSVTLHTCGLFSDSASSCVSGTGSLAYDAIAFQGSNSKIASTIAATGGKVAIGSLLTAPADSHTATLAFGISFGVAAQNTLGYDILVNITVAVTAATAATFIMGVGPTDPPTTDTVVPSFTIAAFESFSFTAIVPNNYWLLVNTTGAITTTSLVTQVCPI